MTVRTRMFFLKPHESAVGHSQFPGTGHWIHLRLLSALQSCCHKNSSQLAEVASSSSFEYPVASSTLGLSLRQPSSPILEGPSSSGRRTLGWSENRRTSPEKRNRDGGGNVTLLSEVIYSQPFERMTPLNLTKPGLPSLLNNAHISAQQHSVAQPWNPNPPRNCVPLGRGRACFKWR
jgi:hypothetical protein